MKKIFYISAVCTLLCLLISSAAAQNLFPNPGCETTVVEKGKTVLKAIQIVSNGNKSVRGGADTRVFHSGKGSVYFSGKKGKSWGGIHLPVPAFKGSDKMRMVTLSFWYKGEKCDSGYIVLMGDSPSKRQLLWSNVGRFKGTFGWKKFQKDIIVPPHIRNFVLSVRLNGGAGKFWVDDAELKWAEIDKPLVMNPAFELGFDKKNEVPLYWEKRVFEGWETNASASVVYPGCASRNALKITWKSGGSKSGIQTPLLVAGKKRRFTVSSDFKSTNKCPGGFLVEFFDSKGKLAGSISSPFYDNERWQKRRFAFELPPKATHFRVVLLLQGNGAVWYDNVTILSAREAAAAYFPLSGKVISVNASLIWNKGKGVFNTFADSPVPLTINMRGYRDELKNPALVVEIPAELFIAQTFEGHTDFGHAVTPEVRSIQKDGKKYTRYTFRKTTVWGRLQPGYAWYRSLTMAMLPRQKSAVGKSFKLCWYFENNRVKGKEQSFTVNMLPPLPRIKLPRNFKTGLWGSHSSDFPDRELFIKVARKYELCNMNFRQRATRRREFDDILLKRKWDLAISSWTADYGFRGNKPDSYFIVPGFEDVAERLRYRTMKDGSIHKGKLCPEYFLRDEFYTRYAQEAVRRRLFHGGHREGEVIFLDSEPWSPTSWCYDEPCRKAFAKFAKLPKVPSAAEIQTKHQDAFFHFRYKQCTETMRKLTWLVRKAYPRSVIIDYDYPMPFGDEKKMAAHLRGCAKNSLVNEAFIDAHLSSYYHTLNTREFDMIKLNMQYLKKPYYIMLALEDGDSYLNRREVLSPTQFYQHFMVGAALGVKGVWIYSSSGSETDGAYFVAIHKGMGQVARLQPFFDRGVTDGLVRMSVNGNSDLKKTPVRFCVNRKGSELLVSVFNYDTAKSFKGELSGVKGKIISAEDPLTGKKFSVGSNGKLVLDLKALGTYFIKLRLNR